MAWTTSASLCARPFSADLSSVPKKVRYVWAVLRRSSLHARSVLFLSLSAVSLGVAAPLLPTTLLTGILIVTGIALAVVGAGANLAGTITSSRSISPVIAAPAMSERPSRPIPPEPVRQATRPAQAVRAQHPRPARTNRDWAELMSRINHDLRTPLNAVIGFSEVMSLEMFGPLGNERYQEYVRHINDSAADLLKSAEDTLALTALLTDPRPSEAPSVTVLEHAIADAWTFLERKAVARNVGLALSISPDIEVMSDQRALRQILVNMLAEGIARTAPGTHISLLAVADGELIEIVLTVSSPQSGAVPRAGSLSICLARTLLEMQGTSLLEIETAAGGWSAVTVLDRAAQPDFFTHDAMPAAYRYQPAMAL
ncbi:MAG: sensor histidine kinase [Hyphomicrobium sp.]